MKNKHTPGPWKVSAILNNRIVGDESTVKYDKLQINNYHCTIATVYRAEDARIIAAAPDMLEALRECLTAWHAIPSNFDRREPPYLQHIRATIAKAESHNSLIQ